MDTIRYYLPGIILILLAILIVAVPEILVAFVASIIIMAGIGALLGFFNTPSACGGVTLIPSPWGEGQGEGIKLKVMPLPFDTPPLAAGRFIHRAQDQKIRN